MTETITKTTFLNQTSVRALLQESGVPMSRSTWINGVATGKFPQPSRLTPARPVWKTSDIEALIAAL